MDALREGSSLTELGHRSAVGAPELRAMAPRAIFPGSVPKVFELAKARGRPLKLSNLLGDRLIGRPAGSGPASGGSSPPLPAILSWSPGVPAKLFWSSRCQKFPQDFLGSLLKGNASFPQFLPRLLVLHGGEVHVHVVKCRMDCSMGEAHGHQKVA